MAKHTVWSLGFVLGCCALATPALAGPAVSFPFFQQSGCGPNNVEGWEFHTTASVTVSALGVYDSSADGTNFEIPVGLYDSGCKLLASAAIPAGTVAPLLGNYRYVGITPVVLPSDQTFRIAAVMHCNDFSPQFNTLTNVAIDPSLTAVQTRRIAFGSTLACPTETILLFEFAPNFLIGPACGNGVVQADEECDDGNTADGDCCSAACKYETNGSPCPGDGNQCTDDVCNATGTCTHPAGNPSAICRAAAGECDVAEQCDGISPSCPPDAHEPDGTPCTDDGLYCTGSETCQGGTCTSSGDPCELGTCDESTDQCLTPTPTVTATQSASPSATATLSATAVSATVTPSRTSTPTATLAPTSTRTNTATQTPGQTPTATLAPTGTRANTATRTPGQTATASRSVTQTDTGTPTATPTSVATPTSSAQLTVTQLPTSTATPASVPCEGDCDGNGSVTISELITGVAIALGSQPIDRCLPLDSSGNGHIEINELIAAVGHALNGCPSPGAGA